MRLTGSVGVSYFSMHHLNPVSLFEFSTQKLMKLGDSEDSEEEDLFKMEYLSFESFFWWNFGPKYIRKVKPIVELSNGG